jgi:hypothetical protein
MKSKIRILLITAIIFLNMVVNAYPYTDVTPGTMLDTVTKDLAMMNIIDGYPDGTFQPDVYMTKAEVVVLICRFLNLVEVAKSQQFDTCYYDVDVTHWACGYINALKNYGLLDNLEAYDQYERLVFLPDQLITYDEGVCLIVGALGYKPKAMAYGGYPTGYMLVANGEWITVGILNMGYTSPITRSTIARLIYNALDIKLMEKISEDEYGITFEKVNKTQRNN